METGATSQVSIGYLASDAAARALAERIVALGDSSWFARGLASHDLETALQGGAMDAYILSLPIRSLVPCRDAMWPTGPRWCRWSRLVAPRSSARMAPRSWWAETAAFDRM